MVENQQGVVCCAVCHQQLDERELRACQSDPARFGGMLLCFEHQRRFSACPAVRGPKR